MITSSPCFQFTGVDTRCFAVSWSESIARGSSLDLRPVLAGTGDRLSPSLHVTGAIRHPGHHPPIEAP